MKSKFTILFIVLLGIIFYQCSSDSSPQSNQFEINKLETICKVWGFLKYYHPGVGSGEIDWDEKLIETLKIADTINDKTNLNLLINELIEICSGCCPIKPKKEFLDGELYFKRDLQFLKDSTFLSFENIELLNSLINNRQTYSNYYVTQNNDIGNLSFSNEKLYADSVFPSKNLRLLTLFRYWNIIYYFHPYLESNDVSWEVLLHKYIPEFINVGDTLDFQLKVLEFTSQLNDGHIWTENLIINLHFGIYSPPYKLICIDNTPIINELFPDSLGQLYNVQVGDKIVAINNVPIEDIISNKSKYYSFSNQNQYNRRIYEELLITSNKDSIILDIKRKKEKFQEVVPTFFLFELYEIQERENKEKIAYRIINDSIGYINLRYLYPSEVGPMMNELQNLGKLIIDIRNYPNGVLYEISKYLNPKPAEFVRVFYPDLENPGNFIWWDPPLETGIENNDYYNGKVVLIVNEQTQSHAEFTAMCLQTAPGVTTIGSMTAGTDGNVSYVYLPGDIITFFTGIGIEYPDGTPTQRVGIKVDSIIRPQKQDYENNYDRLLDYASKLK